MGTKTIYLSLFLHLIGGIGIGVLQRNMEVSQAMQTYTILSIGDGLVSQIPALVISTAAGILVTRSAEKVSLGETLTQQLFLQPKVLKVLSLSMLLLALVSLISDVLPWFPFLCMGVLFGFMHRNFEERGLLVERPVGPCGLLRAPVGACGPLWPPVGPCVRLRAPAGACGYGAGRSS